MIATVNGIRNPSRWYRSRRPRRSPIAYTDAIKNPPTTYAATIMWSACSGMALLKITASGSTAVICP